MEDTCKKMRCLNTVSTLSAMQSAEPSPIRSWRSDNSCRGDRFLRLPLGRINSTSEIDVCSWNGVAVNQGWLQIKPYACSINWFRINHSFVIKQCSIPSVQLYFTFLVTTSHSGLLDKYLRKRNKEGQSPRYILSHILTSRVSSRVSSKVIRCQRDKVKVTSWTTLMSSKMYCPKKYADQIPDIQQTLDPRLKSGDQSGPTPTHYTHKINLHFFYHTFNYYNKTKVSIPGFRKPFFHFFHFISLLNCF